MSKSGLIKHSIFVSWFPSRDLSLVLFFFISGTQAISANNIQDGETTLFTTICKYSTNSDTMSFFGCMNNVAINFTIYFSLFIAGQIMVIFFLQFHIFIPPHTHTNVVWGGIQESACLSICLSRPTSKSFVRFPPNFVEFKIMMCELCSIKDFIVHRVLPLLCLFGLRNFETIQYALCHRKFSYMINQKFM